MRRVTFAVVGAFLAVPLGGLVAPADERLAVPSPAEAAKAQQLVKELFAGDYGKTKPAERAALAVKLLRQASDTKNDPASRFVLLYEARDMAVKAGDALTAARAAEDLAAFYQITAGEARQPLVALATAAMTPDAGRAAADILLAAADAVTAADDWDAALALLKAAETVARKSKNVAVTAGVKTRRAHLERAKTESEGIKEHVATLTTNPNDVAANLAVGRYLCLVKRDWEAAIPLLIKGARGPLKEAVDKDVAAAKGDEAAQMAAADTWYDLAAKMSGDTQTSLQLRAHHWYLLAFPKASGLNKVKAEKRIAELQSVAESFSDKTKVWLHIRKAIAEQKTKQCPIVGGVFARKPVEEMPQGGGLLIGFRYTTINNGQHPGVIQAIYLTATGESYGTIYGQAERGAVPQMIKARPGYAVGAIYTRGGGGMDAFKPIFMRIKDKGLDTHDAYDGPHVGGQGGSEGTLGGDGNFIVGLHGKVNDKGKLEAMSPISLTTETPAKPDGPVRPVRPLRKIGG
jgi:hypothetical protein